MSLCTTITLARYISFLCPPLLPCDTHPTSLLCRFIRLNNINQFLSSFQSIYYLRSLWPILKTQFSILNSLPSANTASPIIQVYWTFWLSLYQDKTCTYHANFNILWFAIKHSKLATSQVRFLEHGLPAIHNSQNHLPGSSDPLHAIGNTQHAKGVSLFLSSLSNFRTILYRRQNSYPLTVPLDIIQSNLCTFTLLYVLVRRSGVRSAKQSRFYFLDTLQAW